MVARIAPQLYPIDFEPECEGVLLEHNETFFRATQPGLKIRIERTAEAGVDRMVSPKTQRGSNSPHQSVKGCQSSQIEIRARIELRLGNWKCPIDKCLGP